MLGIFAPLAAEHRQGVKYSRCTRERPSARHILVTWIAVDMGTTSPSAHRAARTSSSSGSADAQGARHCVWLRFAKPGSPAICLFLSLARHKELDTLKAAGMSVYWVSVPMLVLACLIRLCALLFQEALLPGLNMRAQHAERALMGGGQGDNAEPELGSWSRRSEGRFFRAGVRIEGQEHLLTPSCLRSTGVSNWEPDWRQRSLLA